MKNLRTYGRAPFQTAVIHGGPGVPGKMAPVAQEISSAGGVLEPLQTANTIGGQIEELKEIVIKKGSPPITLIGWSWGAWLSYIFAAENAALVKKLVLIASGPFEEKYARDIMRVRLGRLSEADAAEALLLINVLEKPGRRGRSAGKDDALWRLGKILSKADSFEFIPHKNHRLGCRYDIYQNVWRQASNLRSSGKLLEYGKKIKCPVAAIHGDYDPHPAEGINRPLARILKDFRFILLKKCGHTPWIERWAKDRFYDVLRTELDKPTSVSISS